MNRPRRFFAALAMGLAVWFAEPGSILTGVPLGAAVFAAVLIAVGGLRLRHGALPALDV